MSFADQPPPELLSGHEPNGAVSVNPHLAVVPLPFVGSEHADGSLMGVGLVLPRSADATARRTVLDAIARLEAAQTGVTNDEAAVLPIHLGGAGVWQLQRVVWGEHRNLNLRPKTWTHAARRWASATPVALDRNPGDLHVSRPRQAACSVRGSHRKCRRGGPPIGLPAPVEVDVVRSCVLPGSAKPRTFPRFPSDTARAQRVFVHVRLVFPASVRGPILLGAGRYHGLGLCRPVDDDREGSP